MKTRLIISLCAFLVCLLGSNISQAQIVVKVKPAKPKVLVIKPAKAKKGHVWRNGHWQWNKSAKKYVWVKGHWAKVKLGHAWVPGHWKSTSAGHNWVPGHWKQGGKHPPGKKHAPHGKKQAHPGKPHKHPH